MEVTELKILSELPKEEYFMCGHNECPACGAALVVRLALKVLGRNTIVVLPPNAILASAVRLSSFMVPTASAPMASAAALASGIVRGRRVLGNDRATVVVFGGDASTVDMGFQALSAAAARGDDFLYICYDNESNVNTGDQASSTTPLGAVTPTTPHGKAHVPKDMAIIMAEHGIPYVATASVAMLGDYVQKVQKAALIEGPKYIHVHTVCPCAWKIPDERMLEVGRLAVETRAFPLFEVLRGTLRLTYIPATCLPVDAYLGAQGRFKEISPLGRAKFQEWVNDKWERLYRRHTAGTTSGGVTSE
ncbi:MAG: pyruvate synthase subunit beta [Chloroflexi bacterium]|nr:pyruvate synthase subunit beta [Chloroflexota bacterium]